MLNIKSKRKIVAVLSFVLGALLLITTAFAKNTSASAESSLSVEETAAKVYAVGVCPVYDYILAESNENYVCTLHFVFNIDTYYYNPDYEYDKNSNSCKLAYVTTPNISLGILKGNTYDEAVTNVQNAYATVGLQNNLNFVKVSKEESGGRTPGTILSIDPAPNTRIHISQTITVRIAEYEN